MSRGKAYRRPRGQQWTAPKYAKDWEPPRYPPWCTEDWMRAQYDLMLAEAAKPRPEPPAWVREIADLMDRAEACR